MTLHDVTHLVLHHSLTHDGSTLSWSAIRRYHMAMPPQGQGWADIGYHFGVEDIAGSTEILCGRPLHQAGAHAPGANAHSFGICVIGNFDVDPVPPNTWIKTVFLAVDLCRFFAIPPRNVLGHREVTPHRTCPGVHFNMDTFRQEVANGLR